MQNCRCIDTESQVNSLAMVIRFSTCPMAIISSKYSGVTDAK